jgi:molybdopterin-guanine dinucleotide biosynthesis protein A
VTDNWQPIETAPKDGTAVLVAWDNERWHPLVCHYEGGLASGWGVMTSEMDFDELAASNSA